MSKYFDFEKEIEKIDIKIFELEKLKNQDNAIKINNFNVEKKKII